MIKENQIWDIYNLTRDVESVFRCLKTDLDIRPIYHQKDKYIEPHIWLGILAYQVVNKMRSMQSSTVVIKDNKEQMLYIKLCTRPTIYQKSVFSVLAYKDRPFVRKEKVVTQK
ncbi:MAG: hypothetical protein V3V00_05140 [Saprospiraceae bacterium]